ncbi:hypothetical protein SH449x_002458 [Pirellulaceae bacterium SH449]
MSTAFVELTQAERDEYNRLVNFVRARREAFREVLEAIEVIHAKKLYREAYSTFSEFCLKELGIDRNNLDRLQRGKVNMDRVQKHAPEVKSRLASLAAINALESIPNADIRDVVVAADTGRPMGPTARDIKNAAVRLAVDHKPVLRNQYDIQPRLSDLPQDDVPGCDSIEVKIISDAKRAIEKFFKRIPGVEEQAAFICKYHRDLALAVHRRMQDAQSN